MKRFSLLMVLACTACEPQVVIGDGDAGVLNQDSGVVPDAGPSGPQVVGGCPRVILGRSTDVTYSVDTATLTDIVTSPRLEWTDAPDDALEFTAPETGQYRFDFTSANPNLLPSRRPYSSPRNFTRADCGPQGSVVAIDGIFDRDGSTVLLTADERVVIFVSAPYWSAMKTGSYTLHITKQP